MSQRWTDSGLLPINPPGTSTEDSAQRTIGLDALRERVRADLFSLRHPETPWMPELNGPDGRPMLDVLIVGAGQGGLAVGGLLQREQVNNILLIDKAASGSEGVWNDFARMPVIRSPKHYPGPDMGVPNLTYEAWHRALFGDAKWDALAFVTIERWVEYLSWVRETLELPVRNETTLMAINEAPGGLALTLRNASGKGEDEVVYSRRLVLATGHDGTGSWWMPEFIAQLPEHLRAHAADPIDFSRLAGKKVAVVGVGASGGDNAICALEAGAESVHMFCRRDTHRRQQVYRWCITAGFMRHFRDLNDAWRWRFMQHVLNIRMGMPPETWKRVSSFGNFELHTNADWRGATARGDKVEVDVAGELFEADFIIAATGHDQNFASRPELAPFADKVMRWADRYQPPAELVDERLSRYPYVGWNFELLEREPGGAPFLNRIHDFTFGPTLSFGPSGCSISTLRLSAPMLVAGVTRGLFTEDVETHWQSLLAHPNMIP
ncbi:MAG: cation diffusion facilitator CzcD-associated flavoprotein CzcO [Gammaproteobacteria bacterium]|jgi:cation diffusion facilitator CzcD-associated flavoprotein CzcO